MKTKDVLLRESNFISFKEVQEITGMSRSTIYRQVKRGNFPKPRSISERKVGFLQKEFETWFEDRKIA
jgi:prophage regulatory protein